MSGAAAAGDFNSLSKLSTYSDSFLATSRTVNGSGTQYVADFNQVLDALAKAATATPDTLTASIAAMQVETQTTTLVAALARLQAEVTALRTEVSQGNGMPARIAA